MENKNLIEKVNGKVYYALVSILGAIVLIGAVAWALEIEYGLILTNMRDVVSWGLYISTFAWFVGVSAGGLILSSSAAIFKIGAWKPLSKMASFVSAVVIAAAALIIMPDLGQPGRVLNLIIYAHTFSPLIWDFSIIATYLIISLLELWFLISSETLKKAGNEPGSKMREKYAIGLAFIALPVAIFTHSITAWIFGLQISRPWWNTALLAPAFVASALVSGLALVLLVILVNNRLKLINVNIEEKTKAQFSKLLIIFILVDLYLLFSEYLTIAWPGEPSELAGLYTMFFGPYWYIGWGQWILALLAVIILARPSWRASNLAIGTASVFALVEVFFYRMNLIIPALANPLIQYPPGIAIGGGISSAYALAGYSFQIVGQYFPSPIEWAITAGFVAGVALIILVGLKHLPLGTSE
ncbi:MAG: NrfD/PsrC family molybdoenzyme membrane anchor subunit [Conexivisphaerales archaeon]